MKIKEKILKWLLPDKQYYIQAQGFHSHFHSIFNDVVTGEIHYGEEETDEVDSGRESIY